MTVNSSLTPSRQGAWIINVSKHLFNTADPSHLGLTNLENIIFAGKCGHLLIKLSADDTEQLSAQKVKIHARSCGISPQELPVYLDSLKVKGCIDWDKEKNTYEVLSCSRERVLTTTSSLLYESLSINKIEKCLPDLLQFCLLRPRLESEVKNYISKFLLEDDILLLLGLVKEFQLLGVLTIKNRTQELLYFNGYQFGDRASDIGKALSALSEQLREELNILTEAVLKRPGTPFEISTVSEKTKSLAISLGLVEVSEVSSKAGNAKFLTAPLLAPPSVGRETSHLEDDVFHHAKMLLSSLRFGELRSYSSRGRINDPSDLVKALLNRDRVGPCTAIGQDYILLETEGVIKTLRAENKPGQYYMQIRRKEPARMVLGLLQSGNSEIIDMKSLPLSLELPLGYTGPEPSRVANIRKTTTSDPEVLKSFLEIIRT